MLGKEISNFNNGNSVVEKFQKEDFPEEFSSLQINESGTGEVAITDENIKNNAKFVVDMFGKND